MGRIGKQRMKPIVRITLYVAVFLAVLAGSFFGTAGLVRLVCWAFGLAWSWKISVGIWAAMLLISAAVKSTGGKK